MDVNEIMRKAYSSGGWLAVESGKLGFPKDIDPKLKDELRAHKDEIIPLLAWDGEAARQLWIDAHEYVYRIFKEILYLFNGSQIRPCKDWQIDLWVSGHDNPIKEKVIEAEKSQDMGAYRAYMRQWALHWLERKRELASEQKEAS